jgi:hypothetical protein
MDPNTARPPRRYRRAEASSYLKERWNLDYRPTTLAKLASIGGGPRFEHAGRFPLYRAEELDAWALARFSPLKSSTSDTGKTGGAPARQRGGGTSCHP